MAETTEGATKQERVDFLKQTMAFNEANIRAYDIKAQVSLAAFVLSGNPLIAIVNGACGTAARPVLVIALVVFTLTILMHLSVLWPVSPSKQKLTKGSFDDRTLFYIDPLAMGVPQYAQRLKNLAVEPELIAETLKLSFIRAAKARRFKKALVATFIAYLLLAAAFFIVGRCAL